MNKVLTLKQAMNNKNFDNEFEVKVIDNDIPISFTDEDYEVIEGVPHYTDMPIESTYGQRENKMIKKRTTNEEDNKYKEYEINIRTKTFHWKRKERKQCTYISKVEPKYIQETKAYEGDIIDRKFKLCKKCTGYQGKK